MIEKVGAHIGRVNERSDREAFKISGRTNAGEEKKLRSAEGSTSNDDFVLGGEGERGI